MKNYFDVKNLVTGFVFSLPKEDVDRLFFDEPHNFKVIDKEYVPPKAKPQEKTVYEKVIEDDTTDETGKTQDEVKGIAEYTYAELKEYLKQHKQNTSGKKEDLLQRALEYNKELTDLILEAEERGVEITQNPITVDELKELLEKVEVVE